MVEIVPIFATPFAVVPVAGAEALNPALVSLFPERAADEPGGGLLRFLDTRLGSDCYLDTANRRLRSAFALRSREVRLEEGR